MIPPSSKSDWRMRAAALGPQFQAIHNLDSLKSGSKIGEEQFLALRVYWAPAKTVGQIDPKSDYGLSISEAASNLAHVNHWRSYCHTVEGGLGNDPNFGRFDLLWSFQKQVQQIYKPVRESDKISSPISSRTRMGIALRQKTDQPSSSKNPFSGMGHTASPGQTFRPSSKFDQYPLPHPSQAPSTPSKGKSVAHGASTPETPFSVSMVLENEYDTPSFPQSMDIDDLSPAATSEDYQFPPADDEQTVNTALILALNAVCLSRQRLVDFPWSLERKAFIFKTPSKKLYEARTDGHLRFNRDGKDISLAILEVKAGIRTNTWPQAQESAQMAAWIHAEPDAGPPENGKYRRLMISQDRHEVWIIIAEYTRDYVKYLRGEKYDDDTFMAMREFGPFNPESKGHLLLLGACLQAFTLRLLEKARGNEPFRW